MSKKLNDVPKKLLKDLYWNQELSLDEIGAKLGCHGTTVLQRMKDLGIPRRSRYLPRPDITKERLQELHWEQGLNISQVAEALQCTHQTILNKAKKLDVRLRTLAEEKARQRKYPRHDWDGPDAEKAYLIGFRLGDLTVREQHGSIQVLCSSTRREQIDLVQRLFSSYAGSAVSIRRRGSAMVYSVSYSLSPSFNFLLPKEDNIESWILAHRDCFCAFLGGYIDAEGCFHVRSDNNMANFLLSTCDRHILHQIHVRLQDFEVLCPAPRIVTRKGYQDKRGYRRNHDVWLLAVYRKVSLERLIELLAPWIRHPKRRQDMLVVKQNIKKRNQHHRNK